jgi:hypothetical protein
MCGFNGSVCETGCIRVVWTDNASSPLRWDSVNTK